MKVVAFTSGSPQLWAMIVGQCLIAISHGVNHPCGQAGAIGDFPEHAGRAAALSGLAMMVAAIICGQLIAQSLGISAWPLVISNVIGSAGIALVAWVSCPGPTPTARLLNCGSKTVRRQQTLSAQ